MHLQDATLQAIDATVRPVIMAFYTEFCCVGNTLNNKLVRKSTVDQYLDIAITYVKSNITVDPSIDPFTNKRHGLISSALDELKRWEKVPNRRMPLTIPMIMWLIEYAKTKHEDSLENALADWFIMGIHTGYRSIEWCQEKDPKKHGFYRAEDPDMSIYAVCENDITFDDAQGRRCQDYQDPSAVTFNETFRFQKNKDNGQIKSFTTNTKSPHLCSKAAMQRIISRAKRLGVDGDNPLAVYKKYKGSQSPTWIVRSSVDRLLKLAAAACYELSPTELKTYSSHSLRVGASVILNAAGFSEMDIMSRLRWKSDAYKVYLRNITILAAKHSQAVSSVDIDQWCLIG
jgi:hypothetical protein